MAQSVRFARLLDNSTCFPGSCRQFAALFSIIQQFSQVAAFQWLFAHTTHGEASGDDCARFGPWRKDHADKALDGVEPARKTIDQLLDSLENVGDTDFDGFLSCYVPLECSTKLGHTIQLSQSERFS